MAAGSNPARSELASDTGTFALLANCRRVSWPRTSVSCAAETGGFGPVEIQLETMSSEIANDEVSDREDTCENSRYCDQSKRMLPP